MLTTIGIIMLLIPFALMNLNTMMQVETEHFGWKSFVVMNVFIALVMAWIGVAVKLVF